MSYSSPRADLRRKVFMDGQSQDGNLRIHRSHDSWVIDHYDGQNEAENNPMVAAVKKEDAQNENGATLTGLSPQYLASSVNSLSVSPFTTAFGLGSIPSVLSSASVSSFGASPISQATERKNISETFAASQSTTSSGSTSVSSSTRFPPALLAFILIFACLFCLVMFLALRRMCRHKQVPGQLASPLFFRDMIGLESDRNQSTSITLGKQSTTARDSAMLADRKRRKTNSFKNAQIMAHQNTLFSIHPGTANPPIKAHGAGGQSRRSRAFQPYAPRPYQRAHPAYTADPESVVPLIDGQSSKPNDNQRVRSKGELGHTRTHGKEKDKENVMPNTAPDRGRRHRDSLWARSKDRASRPLSVIHEADSSASLTTVTGTKLGVSSSSSAVGMRRNEPAHIESAVVPPLPTTNTVAVNIGLAMLTEFSSPDIGLGFQPQSVAGIPSATDLVSSVPDRSRFSNVTNRSFSHSASSGSQGLAYLASGTSHYSMGRTIGEERDITENDASTFEDRPDQDPHFREQAHARLVEQLNLAMDPATNVLVPPPTSFKAPVLPTLSEMALYRADPLYESVTNELFSSYGVRMSTASGTWRMSRVSARISRMLSWVADATSGERLSANDGVSSKKVSMSAESVTAAPGGGVQPLRIDKMRKSTV